MVVQKEIVRGLLFDISLSRDVIYYAYMILLLIFIIGLVWGSGLNAFAYRFYHKKSWLRGRSFCPHCKITLTAYELIPLISFIIQKGKCRKCKKKISYQYPLGEVATAVAFCGSFLWLTRDGATAEALFLWLMFIFSWSAWFVIFVHDFLYTLVFDSIVFSAIGVMIIMQFARLILFEPSAVWVSHSIGYGIAFVIGAGFFAVQFVVSRGRWIGGGDIRLGLLMGITLGLPHVITALVIAYIGGSIISVALLTLKKVQWKSEIPFGTFLACATLVTVLFGEPLLAWYMGLFY
ncbi:MAG TPA: prepilin peptidase [Patescibacteria group bacterium]|nr:prepilin peptidase [Patescibacteria group bacterium]